MNPSTDTHFAQDLLSYGRQELLVKMRFMALPFSKLKPSPDIVGTLVGDKGEVLHYDGDALIMDFAKEKNKPYEKLYHTLYHIVVGKECSGGTREQRSCTPPTQSNH